MHPAVNRQRLCASRLPRCNEADRGYTPANLFSQVGTVVSCDIILDKFTSKSRGFGFVEMSTQEEAAKAIAEFNGKDMDGRALTVNEAKPAKSAPVAALAVAVVAVVVTSVAVAAVVAATKLTQAS